MKAWRYDPKAPENVAYYSVPPQTKLEYGAAYLALAALLAVMTYDVHEMLGQFQARLSGGTARAVLSSRAALAPPS